MDSKNYKYLKLISLAVPFLLILFVFFQNRSLFLDSLNLARNIAERSYFELTSPLSYEQSAPVLYLHFSKFFTTTLGITEYSLRLFPLSLGLISMILFQKASSKFINPKMGLIAILWLGTHSLFVRYSTEPKQYIADLFATVLLLYLVRRYDKIDRKSIIPLCIIGVTSIWLSMPSIFVIAAVLIYYFLNAYRKRTKLNYIIGLSVILSLSFIIQYITILAPTIGSNHMQKYHKDFFVDGTFWSVESVVHDFGLLTSIFRMILGKSAIAIGSGLLLSGIAIWHMIKNKKTEIILLAFPIIAAFGASFLGKYSILERLMLFTMPLFIILIMKGFEIGLDFCKKDSRILPKIGLGILTLGLLVGFVDKQAFTYLITPLEREDNRSSLEYISNHELAESDIICTQHAYPAYDYYINHDNNYKRLNIGQGIKTDYSTNIIELAELHVKKGKNTWILMGHMSENEIDKMINQLSQIGTIKNSYRANHSAAILFSN